MRFVRFFSIGLLVACCVFSGWAGEYRLANGNTLRGEIASADEDGMVVRLDIGGFSSRQPWVSFSQETLRDLYSNPEYRDLVEPFIEKTREEWEAENRKAAIVVRDVQNRIPPPDPTPTFFAAFLTPIGLLILAALLAANLYAAYEIALFRGHSVPLTCAVSFFLPVLGPIAFLAVPARPAQSENIEQPADDLAASSMAVPQGPDRASGGLSLANVDKPVAASAHSQPQIYQRGDNTFNRRFFETKFPGFFRVVLGDAERDLVMVFRTPKQEYVGKRISRISMTELHLVLLSSNSEASISFSDITAVILKHKDAKV